MTLIIVDGMVFVKVSGLNLSAKTRYPIVRNKRIIPVPILPAKELSHSVILHPWAPPGPPPRYPSAFPKMKPSIREMIITAKLSLTISFHIVSFGNLRSLSPITPTIRGISRAPYPNP